MSDPAWPATLPGWIVDGYGYTPVAPFIRTTMDSGQVRVRRRFITTPTNLTVKAVFSASQLATFEAWWENDVYAGTLWCLLPVTNGSGTARPRCRFTEAYQVGPASGAGLFAVTASIETLSMPGSSNG